MPDVLAERLIVASPRSAGVAPIQLQLLELGLAAIAVYLAVHVGATLSAALVAVAVVLGALALFTKGPIAIVGRLSPRVNLALFAFVGVAIALTPVAFRAERSTEALVVLEAGAAFIVLGIAGVLRPRGASEAAAVDRRSQTGPLSLPPAAARHLRTAGRIARTSTGVVARHSPRAARRLGRSVGSLRRRRP